MAAADASFDHLPMELRPPYCTHRLEITLLRSDTIVIFFLPLVLRRQPTYAITQKPTISRPLWPPPMPHMTIFPWRYGHDITPRESLSHLINDNPTSCEHIGSTWAVFWRAGAYLSPAKEHLLIARIVWRFKYLHCGILAPSNRSDGEKISASADEFGSQRHSIYTLRHPLSIKLNWLPTSPSAIDPYSQLKIPKPALIASDSGPRERFANRIHPSIHY